MICSERALPARIRIREVADLAWPVMISMLSYTAMSVVDTIFVGRLGVVPLAAIGLAAVAVHLVQALGRGVLTGVRVAISQETGAKNPEAARHLGFQGLWVALLASALAAGGLLLSPWLFGALGASEAVAAQARVYFDVRLLGCPMLFATLAMNAWFAGRGDTRTPMVGTLLANGLNIALDPLLIFGLGPIPGTGLAGAAAATAIGLGASALYLLLRARSALSPASTRPDRAALRRIWNLGAPMGMEGLLEVVSFLIFCSLLARLGDAPLAAHVMVIRVVGVSFLPGLAVSEAVGVFVGQAVGAGSERLAREAWRSGATLALSIMATFGVLFWVTPWPFLAVFSPPPEVAIEALALLRVAAVFQIFDALAIVAWGALNGAGDTRFTLRCGVAAAWLIKLPLGWALALPLGMGAAGAWLGLTAEIVVIMIVLVARLHGRRWLPEGISAAPAVAPAAVTS